MNIYFVASPLQLISALDIAKVKENNVFFIAKGSERNYFQINKLLESNDISSYIIIYLKEFKISFFRYIYTFFLANLWRFKSSSKIENVYVGDFRNYMFNLLAFSLSDHKYILLDDGLATINVQLNYFSKGKGFSEYFNSNKYKFTNMFFLLDNRIKSTIPDLYSYLCMDSMLHSSQVNYAQKRKSGIVKKVTSDLYFLGSKYSEAGVLSLEYEIYALKFVFLKESKKHKNIYYIPHRDDSKLKIKKIKSIGFIIKDFNLPIEIIFNDLDKIPCAITGFYSTALFNLKCYYEEAIDIYDISDYIVKCKIKRNIVDVYSFLSNVGFNVIKVRSGEYKNVTS